MVLLELNHFSLHICREKNITEMVLVFSLKALQTRQYKIFLLPPTCSVGFCLLPVFLGNGTTGRKESLNVEMTSYASEAVNLKSFCSPVCSKIIRFSSLSLSIIELFVRGSPTRTLPYDGFLAIKCCKLFISTVSCRFHTLGLTPYLKIIFIF